VDVAGLRDVLQRATDAVAERGAAEAAEAMARAFLDQFQENTPVRTGELRDHETASYRTGSGTVVTWRVKTNTPAYAAFRETGGDIYPRHDIGEKRPGKPGPGGTWTGMLAAAKVNLAENPVSTDPAIVRALRLDATGYLRFEVGGRVVYSRHVHQEGSWYLRRTHEWAQAGGIQPAGQQAIDRVLEEAGLE
jgi:Bacteriophage HK97-gp10, putative tail-component